MTKWFHKCDLEWLKARQVCLTATDVKELLPFTKTGRKRTIDDETYLKVLSRKMAYISDDDCISTGSAARGHILEPYAIKAFNDSGVYPATLYHWDDVVITRDMHQYLGLAFSPDALGFEQVNYERNYAFPVISPNQITDNKIKVIGEVKSYYPEKHLTSGYTPHGKHEERWQLATAMAVCDDIDEAYLIFYNPSLVLQLFVFVYTRADLQSEIETVLEVEDNWLMWFDNMYPTLPTSFIGTGAIDEEQRIIKEIVKKEELNPEGEKSVIV